MKITPITDYKEFHRTKDLPGCDKDILLAEVTERGNPEILSFLPDTDPERMAVQSSELLILVSSYEICISPKIEVLFNHMQMGKFSFKGKKKEAPKGASLVVRPDRRPG